MCKTATECLIDYEQVVYDDWAKKLLLYMILYDMELRTPLAILCPAILYWLAYDLQPRIYFTDRQLT